jgi:tetratricopeptide (TPR) repeat protein
MSLNNLAMLYDDMGNYTAAEPLYKEALAIKKKYWAKITLIMLNNLAYLYDNIGNYAAL